MGGIDVRDANGKSCTGMAGQPHAVTLNLYRLLHRQVTHDLGLQLVKLWEHEPVTILRQPLRNFRIIGGYGSRILAWLPYNPQLMDQGKMN
jgi:hypothetical protein